MPHPKAGYKNKAGKKVPGVTTIIGRFKDLGGLLWWAFEQGKLAEQGVINSLYDKRDEAADAGTKAHEMVEAHINGFPVPQHGGAAQQGFENYLKWAENNRIQVVKQEMEMVSEAYQFGGCPDAMGVDAQGQFCILDWKTSNGVYQDYLIQLADYAQLWVENHPNKPIIGGFHLLRFSKDHADFSHHYWSELGDAWDLFKLYRVAYDLDKKLKKRTG